KQLYCISVDSIYPSAFWPSTLLLRHSLLR
ncbi:unnamed protein product, partial [Nezara viridula]